MCGSCTYPEAGFFALSGVNRSGERVSFHPFMVEELTDDTTMTTDFVLFWPRGGDLIEARLKNSDDFSRRQWSLELDTSDSGAGTIVADLIHSAGKLHFSGRYQLDPRYMAWPLHGEVKEDPREDWLQFTVGLPPLPEEFDGVTGFDLLEITRAEFEDYLGNSVEDAVRLLASPAMITSSDELPPAYRTSRPARERGSGEGASSDEPLDPAGERQNERPR